MLGDKLISDENGRGILGENENGWFIMLLNCSYGVGVVLLEGELI
jgi:hypothetical protein